MKPLNTILFLSLTLAGCGTTRPVIVPLDPLTQLRKNINSILADSLFVPARVSIKVASLENGNILYDHDSKALMNPGSNMKLLTSAAALSILDTNYQFKTAVFIDASPTDGILIGNIYVKGYGDPDLKTSDLDTLANIIHQTEIKSVEGDIIVDDSFFDDNYWGAGWTWDDDSDPDAPYINALSVNKNCIRITLLTDSTTIYPYIEPMTDFVTIVNRAKLTTDSIRTPLKIKRLYLNNPNTIITEGELSWFSQVTQRISLRRPEYYTGTLLKESLRHAGILVYGNIVNGVTPIGLHEIAQHYQPIEKMITNMNKVSDNLSAENTLKVLGATVNGVPGSAKSGIVVVKHFLSNMGIDTSKLSIVDGSGVSRYNLLSADQLVQFLTVMYKQSRIFPIFYNSLPIAGVDGTLARRMTTYPAACNLRAKTGTLNGVSCLSGYVLTRDGEMLAFSMMMQNFITSVANYHQAQDRIGALLAGFSRRSTMQQGLIK
jgi:D-alanyl-D-alanine carboxypeptidase/D-alanyl-D-alanine-endopeptidase (penicillin-binding protein 4)